jgi:hypothetical protein
MRHAGSGREYSSVEIKERCELVLADRFATIVDVPTALARASSMKHEQAIAAWADDAASGPDLLLDVDAPAAALVATSEPDWPGWHLEVEREAAGTPPQLVTVNHAFVGLRVPKGRSRLRLVYRPPGFREGLAAFAAGCAVIALSARRRRRTR